MKAKWITREFEDKLRKCPSNNPKEMKHDVRTKFEINISVSKCWRASHMALETIRGFLFPWTRPTPLEWCMLGASRVRSD